MTGACGVAGEPGKVYAGAKLSLYKNRPAQGLETCAAQLASISWMTSIMRRVLPEMQPDLESGVNALCEGILLCCSLLVWFATPAHAQTGANDWTWMGGSIAPAKPGIYGKQGTPDTGNLPGPRKGSTTFTDSSGNFWLFGGDGVDSKGVTGYLNDLWKFNPATNQWEWVSGSATANPVGLYGKPLIAASGNVPGGRAGATGWTDANGNLWLFGGFVAVSTPETIFDDLWQFNPSTGLWAWMGGSSTYSCTRAVQMPFCGTAGSYSKIGITVAKNMPGSRSYSTVWSDQNGNFWLLGGYGVDANGSLGTLNDLWRFNLPTSQWTWMGGRSAIAGVGGIAGIYGKSGTPSSANFPGSRAGASAWNDIAGNLWLFGGFGFDSQGNQGYLNDLWKFDSAANQWEWVSGSSNLGGMLGQPGVYGSLGSPTPGSVPGGRDSAATWTDKNGSLWLYGGNGFDTARNGLLADLWEFDLSLDQWVWMGGSTTACAGGYCTLPSYGSLGDPAPANTPGVRVGSNTWTDSSGNLWLYGGTTVNSTLTEIAVADLWKYQPSYAVRTPLFSIPPGTYPTPQTVTITDTSPGATIYYTTNGAAPNTSSNIYKNPIAVAPGATTIEAMAAAPGLPNSAVATAAYIVTTPTTTTLTSSPNPSIYGQPITLTATVTPASGPPVNTGSVSFGFGSGKVVNGKAIYIVNNTLLDAGTVPISAQFIPIQGAAPYLATSSSQTLNQIVNKATTSVTLTSSLNPSPFGAQVTLSAIVQGQYGGQPAGAVNFMSGALKLGTANWASSSGPKSPAHISLNVLPIGAAPITAAFAGDQNTLAGNSNTLTQVVAPQVTAGQEWTWMAGSNIGCCQISPVTNSPYLGGNTPGPRFLAASWTDLNGNLWIAGGLGDTTYSNPHDYPIDDLWEFKPSTLQWTYIGSGLFQISDAATWTDKSGNLWLFGGDRYTQANGVAPWSGIMEYIPSTGKLGFTGGNKVVSVTTSSGQLIFGLFGVYGTKGTAAPGNAPGSLEGAAGWTDKNGNAWLFGGNGPDELGYGGFMNTMWEFNPSTHQWAWMNGAKRLTCGLIIANTCVPASPGVYGALHTPTAANTPGGRQYFTSMTDRNGNFWVFGGVGADANSALADLNDLWEFNPASNQWTWMAGNSTFISVTVPGESISFLSRPGVYGSFGVPAPANTPSGRQGAVGWVDNNNNVWIFGGFGVDSAGNEGSLNDLWEFNSSTKQWAWMAGSSITLGISAEPSVYVGNYNAQANYGVLGLPAPWNIPGERSDGAAFTDTSGNFWLFGGTGFDSANRGGNLGDIWRFQPLPNAIPATATSIALTASPANTTYGQPVTLSAKVTAGKSVPPDGETVDFFSNAQFLGSANLAAGAASLTTTATTTGTNSLEAVYGGDINLARSTSSAVSQTVKKANTTTTLAISPNPVVIGTDQNMTMTVTGQFGGTPTGTMSFNSSATSINPGPLSDGSYQTSTQLPVGTTPVSALYSGDTNFNSSTSPVMNAVVNKTPWSFGMSSYPNPAIFGQPVTFTANVGYLNGAITGTVTFYNGTKIMGTATLAYGAATFTTSSLPLGTDSITATYPGNADIDACSSNVVQQVINK